MNDVRNMFERMVDVPAPPLTPGPHLILAARRARARRKLRFVATGAALAVSVAVAVPLLGVTGLVAGPDNAGPPPRTQGSTAAPSQPAQAASCTAQAAAVDGTTLRQMRQMSEVLLGSIPGGVQVGKHGCEASRPNDSGPTSYVGAHAEVLVDGRAGTIHVYRIRDTSTTPTGDLCATSPGTRVPPDVQPDALGGIETNCQELAADGVKIRVGTMSQPAPGTGGQTVVVRHATRYVEGWLILVAELPYTYQLRNPPPLLTTPIFTTPQLALLAADPGLLP